MVEMLQQRDGSGDINGANLPCETRIAKKGNGREAQDRR